MWNRSNPQRDELLSLCQEARERESRVLPTAVSRGRAELTLGTAGCEGLPHRDPGAGRLLLACLEAVPSCQLERGDVPVLGSTAVWWGLCRQPGAQTPWKGKGFPHHEQRLRLQKPLAAAMAERPVQLHPSYFVPQWGAEQRDQVGLRCS